MGCRRIEECFNGLSEREEKGLIVYLAAGDPDLETTALLVQAAVEAGADMVEVGIPFSDPVADGPVIQGAYARALARGVKVAQILEMCADVRQRVQVPLILMSYYNPIFRYGPGGFTRDAAAAGVDGLIVPDLPLEECGELLRHADSRGLALVPLVAPTTTEARLAAIADVARGFVYCVSVTGVTGAREEIPPDLENFMLRVRRHVRLPCAVGFGIAGPFQARRVAPYCDAVVVGSALVAMAAGVPVGEREALARRVELFVCEIKEALRQFWGGLEVAGV